MSLPAPPHVDENLTTVPPLDHSHPTHHTVDGRAISLTSPDPSNTGAIQGAVTAGIATPYPTPEASVSPPPRSSTSPPAAVSLQDKEDLLTPSDSPNLPSPASGLVLDNVLPTGPSLSAHSSITRTDLSLSFPESRHQIPVPYKPSAALVHASGLDPSAAAADDGSPISSLCKGKNDLDPPSVHHAVDSNTTPTLMLPPQTPSLPSVTDAGTAIAGHSSPETSAEHIGR
jgi:hypothetical protein